MKKILLLLIFFPLMFSSCADSEEDLVVDGYKPIYATKAELQNIYATTSTVASEQLGKIYYKDPYIYINESGKGIHIVNNTNPTAPEKVGFIYIPANTDIAIKGNYLYANNGPDLVTLDISDPVNVNVTHRVENVYNTENLYPTFVDGYFECVDPEKGFVVNWEEASLVNPNCRRE